MHRAVFSLCLVTLAAGIVPVLWAEEKPDAGTPFTVAEGKLAFTAPKGWTKTKPKNNVIEVEFEVPAAKDDANAGRFTIAGAGGSVEVNIKRWQDQFEQPDGGNSKDKGKVEKATIAGQTMHLVDISGTFKDMPGGPFAGGKTIKRENYRMLAAIVETKEAGNYFLKFYGPKATVAENEKAFQEMLGSLKVK